MPYFLFFQFLLISILLVACGGGGGGSPNSNTQNPNQGTTSIFTTTQPNPCALEVTDRDGYFRPVIHRVSFGSGLGATGINSIDTDQDGLPEIVIGSGRNFSPSSKFILLEYENTSGTYEPVCQSKIYESYIVSLKSFSNQTVQSGTLVALENGDVEIIDHQKGLIASTISTGYTEFDAIKDVLIADGDNDNQNDIIILTEYEISIIDINTYIQKKNIPLNTRAEAFTAGRFTQNNFIEIAINTGHVLLINGNTVSTTWQYAGPGGFGTHFISSGDIDNDGLDEIVGGHRWYSINAFNGDSKDILWNLNPGLDISNLDVIDSNNDGTSEVIYSNNQNNQTFILNGIDAGLVSTFTAPGNGGTNYLIKDFDGDGQLELMWGSGYVTTDSDYLTIANIENQQIEWTSPIEESLVYAVNFGDINGDGIPETLFASLYTNNNYNHGIVSALDTITGNTIWHTNTNTFGPTLTGIFALEVADTNQDNINEVFAGTTYGNNGRIYTLDSSTGNVISSLMLDSSQPITSLKVANIDGDSDNELIAGSGRIYSNTPSINTYIIDPISLSLEQKSPSLGNVPSRIRSIETIDWDQDQFMDIIASFDIAFVIEHDFSSALVSSVESYASASNGQSVFVSNNSELLELHNDGSTTHISTLCDSKILALEFIETNQIAFTCEGKLGVFNSDDMTITWHTGYIDNQLGIQDSLKSTRINNENYLIIGGDISYVFKQLGKGGRPDKTVSNVGSIYPSGGNGFVITFPDIPPKGTLGNLQQNESIVFQLQVSAGNQYDIALTTRSGDNDLYLYNDPSLNNTSLMGSSTNSGLTPDQISFTATQDGMVFIEILGFNASEYHIITVERPPFTADPHLEPGFPVQTYSSSGTYQAGPQSLIVTVGNIDDDTEQEIVVTGHATGPLWAWNHDGSLLPGWPDSFSFTAGYPSIGNVDADLTKAEVVTGFGPYVGSCFDDMYVLNEFAIALSGWPKQTCNAGFTSPPKLIDLDGDGINEIFYGLQPYYGDGTPVPGWPPAPPPLQPGQMITPETILDYTGTIAAGDIDNDGNLDIVLSGLHYLSVFNPDGTVKSGFPVQTPNVGYLMDSVVIGNITGDPKLEIIRTRKIANNPGGIVLEVYDASGTLLWTETTASGESVHLNTMPALADLDGDSYAEIIVQVDYGLYAWKGDGSLYPGWPHQWSQNTSLRESLGNSSPVIADVNGDLNPDIIISTKTNAYGLGRLYVFNRDGSIQANFPKDLPLGDGIMPAVADIDNDGRNEILVGSNIWNAQEEYNHSVFAFDLGNGPHGPILWGQMGGDARRLGVYPVP